ncbi:hypothetical protein CLOP_g12906 [Closterium sp. NIES-67]|nr:hypothetical protein CLOP_g12906 [Closterium sp. NIES-67]
MERTDEGPNTLLMVIVLEKELAAISMQPGDDVKPAVLPLRLLRGMELQGAAEEEGVGEAEAVGGALAEVEAEEKPTVVFCDNESAVKLAKNACLHGLTKHIRPKWHWAVNDTIPSLSAVPRSGTKSNTKTPDFRRARPMKRPPFPWFRRRTVYASSD